MSLIFSLLLAAAVLYSYLGLCEILHKIHGEKARAVIGGMIL